MWISRQSYDDLRAEYIKNHEEARVLAQQNQALLTSLDWLRQQVTQLGLERTALFHQYTGVTLPTPKIHRETPTAAVAGHMPNFDDIGDDEAGKLGIGWNDDGTVRHLTTA